MYRILSIFFSLLILNGCGIIGGTGLKRSANNKLIDSKGFHGGKRMPLYNKKYIDKAKSNIIRGDFEEDEYDDEDVYVENLPAPLKNRYIYEDMIREDIESERSRRKKLRSRYMKRFKENDETYPHMGKARDKIKNQRSHAGREDLKTELQEIKSMLDEARKDLVRYRCPAEEAKKPSIKHDTRPKRNIHEQVKAEEAGLDKKRQQSLNVSDNNKPQKMDGTKANTKMDVSQDSNFQKPAIENDKNISANVAKMDDSKNNNSISKPLTSATSKSMVNESIAVNSPIKGSNTLDNTGNKKVENEKMGEEVNISSGDNKAQSESIPPLPSIPDVLAEQN